MSCTENALCRTLKIHWQADRTPVELRLSERADPLKMPMQPLAKCQRIFNPWTMAYKPGEGLHNNQAIHESLKYCIIGNYFFFKNWWSLSQVFTLFIYTVWDCDSWMWVNCKFTSLGGTLSHEWFMAHCRTLYLIGVFGQSSPAFQHPVILQFPTRWHSRQ